MTIPNGRNVEDFKIAIDTHKDKGYCPICYSTEGVDRNWLVKTSENNWECPIKRKGTNESHYITNNLQNSISALLDRI